MDTRKIKNTTVCTQRERHWFARSSGRIMTMEAPVVPIQEARSVPMSSRIRIDTPASPTVFLIISSKIFHFIL